MSKYKLKAKYSFTLLLSFIGLFVFIGYSQVQAQLADRIDVEAPSSETSKETSRTLYAEGDSNTSKGSSGSNVSKNRDKSSEEPKEQVKGEAILKGQLKAIIVDNFEDPEKPEISHNHNNEESETIYVVETTDMGFVKVILDGAENYVNSYVTLSGVWEDDGSFVAQDLISAKDEKVKIIVRHEVETLNSLGKPTKIETTGPELTVGSRTVLVMRVNFNNDMREVITENETRNLLYSDSKSVNNYLKSISKDRFSLRGIQRPDIDITPLLTLPYPNTQNCPADMTTVWTNDAKNLARTQGFEPNNYRTVALIFNGVIGGCPGIGGQGTLGVLGDTASNQTIWIKYDPTFGGADYAVLWFKHAFTHELGHNLGMHHASGIRNCTMLNLIPDGCVAIEYGDQFSPMGNISEWSRSLNNFNLHQLGWLSPQAKVANLPSAGTYDLTLMAPSYLSKGYQVISFPLKDANGVPTGQSAYLEFRREVQPFEIFYPDILQNVTKGVSVRFGPSNLTTTDKSYLYEFHPETSTNKDPAITMGETYQNNTYGFSIKTNSTHPGRGAKVTVTLSR